MNSSQLRFSDFANFRYGKMPDRTKLGNGSHPVFTGYRIVDTYPEFNADENLIIVARGVGGTGDVKISPKKCFVTNLSIIVDLNSDEIDKKFLYYYFVKGLKQLDSGSAQSQITISDLSNLKVVLPSFDKQKSIVKILGDLDRKIELNQKINETLEQIGQAMFKKYFIEFSQGSEMTMGDVAAIIDCLHSKKPELTKENTGFIFLQLNNILDNGLLDLSTKYYISKDDYIRWTSRIEVKENDFVITNVGRSGAVAKIPQGVTAAMGRNMTAIRLRDDFNFPGFLSFALNSSWMKEQIESKLDHGTILSALNVKSIPTLKLPGSKDVVHKYEQDFLTLRKRIEVNHLESSICASLRDSLLPRLMNGQITL